MKVSVVIPVFNEHGTLPEIVAKVRAADVDKEIILVDDCSTDGSRSLVETLSQDSDIVAIYHEKVSRPVTDCHLSNSRRPG